MLRRLVEHVTSALSATQTKEPDPAERDYAIRVATAVLMAEVATADHEFHETEFERMLELIASHFQLSPEAANELANTADAKAEDLVEIHSFTQLLHNSLSEDEKARVVSLLWQIAYADGRLSRYEDSLVLKISDLLFVNRARVMRLKHDAREAIS